MDYVSGAETMYPSGEGSFLVLLTLEPRLEGHEAGIKAFWEKRFWCTRQEVNCFGDRTGVSVFKETQNRVIRA